MQTHCYALAVVLLSALVYARHDIVIKDADDLNRNPLAKREFCGIVNQCNLTSGLSGNVVSELKHGLEVCAKTSDKLEQENANLKSLTKALQKHVDELNVWREEEMRADFNQIADLKPLFWLSGKYYDGYDSSKRVNRTGYAPSTDVLQRSVNVTGRIPVQPVNGHMAYKFEKDTSILYPVQAGNKFSLAVVFNYPVIPVGYEGKFFSTPVKNKLFAGWHTCPFAIHFENWIIPGTNCQTTTDKVVLILTNDNGLNNVWTHEKQIVTDYRFGAVGWEETIIGRPQLYPEDAVKVNVYQALVFNRVLDRSDVNILQSYLRKTYM